MDRIVISIRIMVGVPVGMIRSIRVSTGIEINMIMMFDFGIRPCLS